MAFKTIATAVRDISLDAEILNAAAEAAEQRDAHLSVVCLGIDRTQPSAYYAGAQAISIEHNFTQAQQDATDTENAVREALKGHEIVSDLVAYAGQPAALGQFVANRMQMADLIILPQPYGQNRSIEDVAIFEGALLGTRVPVLMLPPGTTLPERPHSVVLGWNQSAESLAAIRAAIPLLQEAEGVNVVVIDPPVHGPDRSDPGGALAEMLSRHGIRADISVLAKTMPRVGDVLCRHLEDRDADLLVIGAYGHSRFREAILGGATRSMLEECTVPVLMTH